MRYRQRVTIQRPTEIRSPKGAVTYEWSPVDDMVDVPATIVPSVVETRGPNMTTIADQYDVIVAGRLVIDPTMAVVDGSGRRFEIRQVDPLLGERQTRIVARLLDSPLEVAGS